MLARHFPAWLMMNLASMQLTSSSGCVAKSPDLSGHLSLEPTKSHHLSSKAAQSIAHVRRVETDWEASCGFGVPSSSVPPGGKFRLM